jgi:oligopeptide transport system substrate-binding protein
VAPNLIGGTEGDPTAPPSRTRRIALGVAALLVILAFLLTRLTPAGVPQRGVIRSGPGAAGTDSVTILAGRPASIDPAGHGDAGSAAIVAQLFETLTTFDATLTLRPALAESWAIEDGGMRVVFRLREGLTFSDGSPLTADDVVRSWRRLVVPGKTSDLASLLIDVRGVRAILDGTAGDPSAIGIHTDGDRQVVVELERPAADFPAIASSPPLAIVPAAMAERGVPLQADGFVGSGGYLVSEVGPDRIELVANGRYWAGPPAIGSIRLITDLAGRSSVEAFEDGTVDIASIGDSDARWIAWDKTLGGSLRAVPALSLDYYGFDTTDQPFDDVRVRRAFAMAVDWRRLGELVEPGESVAATGMVPLGIPGRPDGDFLPTYDPAGAKRLLAEAGIDAARMAPVEFVTSGGPHDEAVVTELRSNLGVPIEYATLDFGDYTARLKDDAPAIWNLSWVADYPSPNDFLGVLLGTGSTANSGGWSSPAFDAAIAEAGAGTDPTAAYVTALGVVRDDVPAIPVGYGAAWALTRDGLLGSSPNGMNILRFAGLAWEPGR